MFNKKEYMKEYRVKNRESILMHAGEYYKDNAEKIKKAKRLYRENNPEKIKEIQKRYREKNSEKILKMQKKARKKFKENNPNYFSQYFMNKCRIDKKFNLNTKMRKAIGDCLKGKENKAGRAWESLTGYTLDNLIKRLNKTMPENYTWDDFLKGKLHVDHIIPIKAHNFTNSNQIDFKNCWALSNLQLLPAKENLIKGAKFTRPFQPTLQI